MLLYVDDRKIKGHNHAITLIKSATISSLKQNAPNGAPAVTNNIAHDKPNIKENKSALRPVSFNLMILFFHFDTDGSNISDTEFESVAGNSIIGRAIPVIIPYVASDSEADKPLCRSICGMRTVSRL